MTCEYCKIKPGNLIPVNKSGHCLECGSKVSYVNSPGQEENPRWDSYFHTICNVVASKSPCFSRQIGAILVRDRSIVSTGYNGPPRGIPHCDKRTDKPLIEALEKYNLRIPADSWISKCPRHLLGFKSGTHMELCPAQHAEENCVSNAARLGVSVINSTLYMNSIIPCQKCFGTLINAGIKEIVVNKATVYDKHTQFLIDNSNIIIRSFSYDR